MPPLPSGDLRSNLGTWAVPTADLPAAARALADALPAEPFDPGFRGQDLATTYFDTPDFQLRRARLRKDRYLTLRLRRYRPAGDEAPAAFALSAKTEAQKWRAEIEPEEARLLLASPGHLPGCLPADLLARLLELAGDAALAAVVAVRCRRYAAEGGADRLTLDAGVRTDTGRRLPYAVLEFKSSDPSAAPPG
jgi:hypothetical protein